MKIIYCCGANIDSCVVVLRIVNIKNFFEIFIYNKNKQQIPIVKSTTAAPLTIFGAQK